MNGLSVLLFLSSKDTWMTSQNHLRSIQNSHNCFPESSPFACSEKQARKCEENETMSVDM